MSAPNGAAVPELRESRADKADAQACVIEIVEDGGTGPPPAQAA